MTVDALSSVCNLDILDSFDDGSLKQVSESWERFCVATKALLSGGSDLSLGPEFVFHSHVLFTHGLESAVQQHFLGSLQGTFEKNGAEVFWQHFHAYKNFADLEANMNPDEVQHVLCKALKELLLEKSFEEKCLNILVGALQSFKESKLDGRYSGEVEKKILFSKYQLIVSTALLSSLPRHFPEILRWYFKSMLEELSTIAEDGNYDCQSHDRDDMDVDVESKLPNRDIDMVMDGCSQQKRPLEDSELVKNIGIVVRDLRNLGFISLTEDAYASAIFLLLKDKVYNLAGDDYRSSVLGSVKEWIQAVPLRFLHELLVYLGDSNCYDSTSPGQKSPLASQSWSYHPGTDFPSQGLVRWNLRLEYFAYETLQDLRIAKLFEIIVDYPDSSPAIEDLKQCLEYTGQHSKLVDSFISALRYRLLTAGASTNDILHQYVSTIKALRTIDPAGVFLEAVGEPIREYLKGRKDTIKCIVTMLTDGTGANASGPGNTGDSLLEELNRDEENQESFGLDDDISTDDKQAWINALRWEPDPVEADPFRGSSNRRKVDILGMVVGIIGSKDQLINEYRVMLAEKLLNKTDYDIDMEIRTLELLKIHFGESNMQKCEIMVNDLIDSKRTNANIKAAVNQSSEDAESIGDNYMSLEAISATIISSNFWPQIQDEALNIPLVVDNMLTDYAKKFHNIKTPRKLVWKKNLGTVKLELQFEDRLVPFTVTPMLASIIMQFQDQTSWSSKNLAAAVGVPVDLLNRRISFWISKGIISETMGTEPSDNIFNLVEGVAEGTRGGANSGACPDLIVVDEDGDSSVATLEDQLHKEKIVFEKFISGMLTNYGSMALDRIDNVLKMFCVADTPYDKSLEQLQTLLSGLVAEEKLEFRDGMYFLKK